MTKIYKRRFLTAVALMIASITATYAYDFRVDGIYYNITSDTEVEVTYRNKTYAMYSGDVVIPESVTYNNVTYTVTGIGGSAFYDCEEMTSVTIPNSVTSIGSYAFYKCTSLTSIEIPNNVTSIGDYAFYYCTSLTSIEIPNSVTSIGYEAFYKCTSLASVTIGNSVTSIGDRAFYYCTSLASVTIGNSVTSIGDEAFYNCTSLTSVEIPNSVTSIGDRAFYNCTSLTDVYSLNVTPPTCGDDVFSSSTYDDATLHVPSGSLGDYDSTSPWSKFYTIEEDIEIEEEDEEEDEEEVDGSDDVTTTDNYISFTCSSLGLENGEALDVITLSDGTTLTFDNGSNSNSPKYYDNGSNIRMYPTNTMTISSSKTIESVAIECDEVSGTICNASEDVSVSSGSLSFSDTYIYINSVGSTTTTVTNTSSTTGMASQIRFTSMTIYYAEGSETGIENVSINGDYPINAADGVISVSGIDGSISVYGINGAKVAATKADGGTTEVSVPKSGVYIVKISDGKETVTKKVIVQ